MDLSRVFFIKSMNTLPENQALRDRIFPITLTGYSSQEKATIVHKFLMTKACSNSGLATDAVRMSKEVASFLVGHVCKREEKGVRTAEKAVFCIVMRVQYLVEHQDESGNVDISFGLGKRLEYPVDITSEMVEKLVDVEKLDDKIAAMYI
jgi:ATP-dependent Lon protease